MRNLNDYDSGTGNLQVSHRKGTAFRRDYQMN